MIFFQISFKLIYFSMNDTRILIYIHPYFSLPDSQESGIMECMSFLPTVLSMGPSIKDWDGKNACMHACLTLPHMLKGIYRKKRCHRCRTILRKTIGHSFPIIFCVQNSFASLQSKIMGVHFFPISYWKSKP